MNILDIFSFFPPVQVCCLYVNRITASATDTTWYRITCGTTVPIGTERLTEHFTAGTLHVLNWTLLNNRGMAPYILKLSTRCRRVVNFTLLTALTSLLDPLGKRLVNPESIWDLWRRGNSLASVGNRILILSYCKIVVVRLNYPGS